jgi:hypothetical protein
MYIESIFVLYVTLCLFGTLNWNNKIIIIIIIIINNPKATEHSDHDGPLNDSN